MMARIRRVNVRKGSILMDDDSMRIFKTFSIESLRFVDDACESFSCTLFVGYSGYMILLG